VNHQLHIVILVILVVLVLLKPSDFAYMISFILRN